MTITDVSPNRSVHCPTLAFTMHLEPQSEALTITWGANGEAIAGGQLVRQTGGEYALAKSTALPTNGTCFIDRPEMINVVLRPLDTDGDGVADKITGNGVGGGVVGLEALSSVAFSFELAGNADVTVPRLTAPQMMHPLDWVVLAASEPLAPTTEVRLEGTSSVALTTQRLLRVRLASSARTVSFRSRGLGTWLVTAPISSVCPSIATSP